MLKQVARLLILILAVLFAWIGWNIGRSIPTKVISVPHDVFFETREHQRVVCAIQRFGTLRMPVQVIYPFELSQGKRFEFWSLDTGQLVKSLETECEWPFTPFRWSCSFDHQFIAEIVPVPAPDARSKEHSAVRVRRVDNGLVVLNVKLSTKVNG